MRPLSASELLNVWERGLSTTVVQRMLLLLAVACPELTRANLVQLSIGELDRRLLTLREWTFGPHLTGTVACPACSDRLEFNFHVEDIRAGPNTESAEEPAADEAHEFTLGVAGFEVRFRLPNSLDLDAATSREALLERCVLAVRRSGADADVSILPTEVVDAVAARMAEADPQADVQLALSCPTCDHRWQAVFDVAAFFWSEIHAWAFRTLREVHVLASAYGWSEDDILALSPWRRQFYLEMVGR